MPYVHERVLREGRFHSQKTIDDALAAEFRAARMDGIEYNQAMKQAVLYKERREFMKKHSATFDKLQSQEQLNY